MQKDKEIKELKRDFNVIKRQLDFIMKEIPPLLGFSKAKSVDEVFVMVKNHVDIVKKVKK